MYFEPFDKSTFEDFLREANTKPDYTTNAGSYYKELARKNHLIELLSKRIWDYDIELAKRFEEWDKNLEELPEDVKQLLVKWLEDGTLSQIINEEIFNTKADKSSLERVQVNLVDFGAVYNDENFDNNLIISKAQDYLISNFGGGTIFIPDNGILYVQPFLNIKSNIHIIGQNRVKLVIPSFVTDFWKLYGLENQSNIKIKNVTIDSNKENRTGYDISIDPQILISMANSKHIEIADNTLIGNGVWIISAFSGVSSGYSQYLKVNNNLITWKAGTSSKKNNLPFNVDVDNTIVYFDALHYEFKHNTLTTNDGLKNMTALEAHGADVKVSNNKIIGFRTGVIVWGLVHSHVSLVESNNIIVSENFFEHVENGITVGNTVGFDLKNIKLLYNTILLDPVKFKRGSSHGIEIYVLSNSIIDGLIIKGNDIDSTIDSTEFGDVGFAYNFTGLSLRRGIIKGLIMAENTVSNIAGTGLLLSAASGTLDIKSGVIENNLFTDNGRNTNIPTTQSQGRSAMAVLANASTILTGLFINENTIIDTKSTGRFFTRPVYGHIPNMKDQKIKTTDRTDWYEWKDFQTDVFFDSQLGSMNIDKSAKYRLIENYCEIEIKISVTSFNITQGYGTNINLPFEAVIDTDFNSGLFQLITNNVTHTGTNSIRTVNKKVISLLYPSVTSSKWDGNSKLFIHLKYPVAQNLKYLQ